MIRAWFNSRFARRLSKTRLSKRGAKAFVTVEFVAGVAMLMLPSTLFVASLPTWFERVDMARVAAREAARTYVISGSAAQATQVVTDIQHNYGMPGQGLTVAFTGANPNTANGRGGSVVAAVTTEIPALHVPIFNVDAPAIPLTVTHSEPIDLYRSVVVN